MPKFRVGDVVAYKGDRRTRRTITAVYWDADYPAWRYKIKELKLRADLVAVWAVVEKEFILVRRGERERGPQKEKQR